MSTHLGRRAVGCGLALAALAGCLPQRSSSMVSAERYRARGEHEQAAAQFEAAMKVTYDPSEFDAARRGLCASADARATELAVDRGPQAERTRMLEAVLGRLERCPDHAAAHARATAALHELALVTWDAEVLPAQRAGQLGAALAVAGPLAAKFSGRYEIWGRYAALRDDLVVRVEAALAAAQSRPLARAHHQLVLHALDPALPAPAAEREAHVAEVEKHGRALDVRIRVAAVHAPVGAPLDASCRQAVERLRTELEAPSPEARTVLTADLVITGCRTTAATRAAIYTRRFTVDRQVSSTENVCKTVVSVEEVPSASIQSCSATRCYQTSRGQQTCFEDCSTITPPPRQRFSTARVCADELVTRTVKEPRTETLPGAQWTHQIVIAGELRAADHEGHALVVALAPASPLLGEVVPERAGPPPAHTPEDVVRDQGVRIAAALRRSVTDRYVQTVMIPAWTAQLAAARERDLAGVVELALIASRAAVPALVPLGRAVLEEIDGVGAFVLDAAYAGRTIPPTPAVPALRHPVFAWHRIDDDRPASIAVLGVPVQQFIAAGHGLRQGGLPGQDPRASGSVQLGMRYAFSSAITRPLGWRYFDQLDLWASLGARASAGQRLLDETGEDGEERRRAYGYRLAYAGMYGRRSLRGGLFAGVMLQQTGHRVGNLIASGRAMPFVVHAELRRAATLTYMLQAWGGDLDLRSPTRAAGASLHVPLVSNIWLFARAERRVLRTQFYAFTADERIDAGAQPVLEVQLGVSFGLYSKPDRR